MAPKRNGTRVLRSQAPKARRKRKSAAALNVKIRMYRQGLGDCFLIAFPKADGSEFFFMIDCGVVLGTPSPIDKMRPIVADIIQRTGGFVDVLAVTHEHWDHVSAFVQVPELFAAATESKSAGKLRAGQLWLAWTEDPLNPLARKLKKEKEDQIAALRAASKKLRGVASAMGMQGAAASGAIDSLLGFFGAAGGTTSDAMRDVKTYVAGEPLYCRPGDSPRALAGVSGVRVYVLGPPENEALLKKTGSSTELYKDAAFAGLPAWSLAEGLGDAGRQDSMQPFDRAYAYPLSDIQKRASVSSIPGSRVTEFFDRFYFGKDPESALGDQSWRRIDADWLGSSSELALALDNATNNTSLVLAFEFAESGRVLLFVADAQAGSWLSWQNLSWQVGDSKVTGPDLLRRTVFYKVGHHGSHNATLKAKGLELMTSPELVAFLPVDHAMASKKGWGRMPLPALVDALRERTRGRLVRVDESFEDGLIHEPSIRASFTQRMATTPLYYEVSLDEGGGQPQALRTKPPRSASALA